MGQGRLHEREGRASQADEAVLDEAGRAGVDLVLLPEYMQGGRIEEPLEGPNKN